MTISEKISKNDDDKIFKPIFYVKNYKNRIIGNIYGGKDE